MLSLLLCRAGGVPAHCATLSVLLNDRYARLVSEYRQFLITGYIHDLTAAIKLNFDHTV
jgi:hypothetical protein